MSPQFGSERREGSVSVVNQRRNETQSAIKRQNSTRNKPNVTTAPTPTTALFDRNGKATSMGPPMNSANRVRNKKEKPMNSVPLPDTAKVMNQTMACHRAPHHHHTPPSIITQTCDMRACVRLLRGSHRCAATLSVDALPLAVRTSAHTCNLVEARAHSDAPTSHSAAL